MNNKVLAYCRLCADLKPYSQLIILQADEEICHQIINKLRQLNVEIDLSKKIPKNVCLACKNSLDNAFDFVSAVKQTQADFNHFLNSQSEAEESDDKDLINEPLDVASEDDININDKSIIRHPSESCNENDVSMTKENVDKSPDVGNQKSNTFYIFYYNPALNDHNLKIVNDNYILEPSKHHEDINKIENEKNILKRENNLNTASNVDTNIIEEVTNVSQTDSVSYEDDYKDEDELDKEDSVTACQSTENTEKPQENEKINSADDKLVSQALQIWKDYTYNPEDELHKENSATASQLSENIEKSQENVQINSANDKFLSEALQTSKDYPSNPEDEIGKQNSVTKSQAIENTQKSVDNEQISGADNKPPAEVLQTWEDYTWLCAYCETEFPTDDELISHSMQYHSSCNPFRCTDCNMKKVHLNSFLAHVRRHRKHLHLSCYKCYKTFRTTIQQAKHRRIHNVDASYICVGCNSGFSTEDEFNKHVSTFYKRYFSSHKLITLSSYMDDDGNFTCKECNKTYTLGKSFKHHIITKHSEEKRQNVCEICGKGFFKKCDLKSHMTVHSDAKHQCEICKSSFKSIYRLRKHAKIHFGRKKFECDYCGKCFRIKAQLAFHIRIHTNTLAYGCTYCNKKFRFDSCLKRHLLQHTGAKPYSCDVCQRDFTNWSNYNKHMKRKHGVDKSKKKRTLNGPHAFDQETGKILYPEPDKALEWKKKMMEPIRPERKYKLNK